MPGKHAVRLIWLAAALGGIAFACGGCGGGDGGPPPPDAHALTEEGWLLYAGADLAGAEARFSEAVALDSTYADGWNGRGWTRAQLSRLDEAVSDLARANAAGLAGAEAWACLAAVYRDLSFTDEPPLSLQLELALAAADSALARDRLFRFSRSPGVDSLDLHLLRAQCLAGLGASRFAEAQAEADFLSPANGLDPGEPSTWVVAGETFAAYAPALLRLIQEIEETVGGDLP